MTANPTVVAAAVGAIERALASYGVDGEKVVRECGLLPAKLTDPGTRVDAAKMDRLIARACAASGDSAFGLSMARQYAAVSYHLHFAMAACETMGAALELLLLYQRMLGEDLHFSIERGADDVSLVYHCPTPVGATWVPTDAASACLTLALRAMTLDPRASATSIALRRPVPSDESRYFELFRCPVTFSQPRNVIRLDGATLSRTLPTANAQVLKRLESMVIEYIADLGGGGVADRLRRFLLVELRNGPPSRTVAARHLALSSRSLARALQSEGTSYREVLKGVRMTLATEYLDGGTSNVTEIAFLLGFSDASAFSRAFRRWTDRPPRDFSRRPAG